VKIKELFKLVETANKLNQLLGEQDKTIEIRFSNHTKYEKYQSFSAFKKAVKNEFISEAIPVIIDMEVVPEKDEANYFSGTWIWTGYKKIYNEILMVHIY